MEPTEAAIAAVFARRERFGTRNDPAALFEPGALEDADHLLGLSIVDTEHGMDVNVPGAHEAAMFFWARWVAATRAGVAHHPDDEAATRNLFDLLGRIDPALVPPEFRQAPPPYWAMVDQAQQIIAAATATYPFDEPGARAAVDLLRHAVAESRDTPDHSTVLGSYGSTMIDLYQCTGAEADLGEAIDALRAAVAGFAADDPMLALLRGSLGGALMRRHGHSRDLGDLAAAEDELRGALATWPPAQSRVPPLCDLASTLEARARTTADPVDAERAIAAARDALAALPPGHGAAPGLNRVLGSLLGDRLQHAYDPAATDECVAALRAGLGGSRLDGSDRDTLDLMGYAAALMTRADHAADPRADLDECVEVLRTADSLRPGDPHVLSALGHALANRAERTGTPLDLPEAMTALARAGDAVLIDLADVALRLYEATDDPAALDRALDAATRATTLLERDDPRRQDAVGVHAAAQWRTGVVHWRRHSRTGQPEDATAAVDAARAALRDLPDDHPERRPALIVLGNALAARAAVLGSTSDTEAAAAAYTDAAVAMADDDPERPTVLLGLGNSLYSLALRQVDLARFDRSEAAYREVLTLDIDDDTRAKATTGLGVALTLRAGITQGIDDLGEAISVLRCARDLTLDDATAAGVRINLANALKLRHTATEDPRDLDEALAALRETRPAPGDRWMVTVQLGELLGMRGDGGPARTHFLDAARDPVTPSWYRVHAARWAAEISRRGGDDAGAYEAYALAVDLLPLIVDIGLDQDDQRRYLADFGGLAAAAAAAALSVGSPEAAVELLDHGRSVLWAQVLRTRGETAYGSLDGLAAVRPDLAEDLRHVRTGLRVPAVAGRPDPPAVSHERMRLAHRHAELVDEIRSVPGFERFLRRGTFAELRAAADNGPVILVNAAPTRCDALIVTSTGVRVVPLAVTSSEVADRARQLAALDFGGGLGAYLTAQDTLAEAMAWLWSTVVAPVLREIPDARRVWWCPTGPFTALPLHMAAPRTGAGADNVVSSYTTTLTSLLRARRRGEAGSIRRLVVGVTIAPGTPRLPAVEAEVAIVAGTGDCTQLLDTEATADRVMAELPHHAWVHVACHGGQNLADPARSALALHDRPLTVAEIATLDLREAELAFLSACETSASTGMPDEALSPAGALHLAGYRHVIATLWSIPDRSDLAAAVYHLLDHLPPAAALHEACQAAKATRPDEPSAWAPYVHFGP